MEYFIQYEVINDTAPTNDEIRSYKNKRNFLDVLVRTACSSNALLLSYHE